MTDTTTNTPDLEVAARLEREAQRLAEKLAESNTRASTLAQELAALQSRALESEQRLTAERDGFKTQVAELAPKAGRLVELEGTVTALTNEKHERSFLEALKASGKFPGADDITLSGAVAKLHEAGKFNRFAADTVTEVAKAIPALIEQAPTLTRPPTNVGGGSPGARQTPAAPVRKSLVG